MRIRTAKTLAERIDLHYFKRAHGLRRWRLLLSAAAPVAALLWVAALAASGSRAPYSPGPVSAAHTFAGNKCEVCHAAPRHAAQPKTAFRSHTTDAACLTCHDGPVHAARQTSTPGCASCHQEHRGRVQLARTDPRFCIGCHADITAFSSAHPEFAAVRAGAADPARVRFNHAVHSKADLRGPNGPERLACTSCHTPEAAAATRGGKRPASAGSMKPIAYQQDCARCHPLFFDERVDRAAPHAEPAVVRPFVRQALEDYIRANPGDISKPDAGVRRVPLNFPRPPEPPARTAGDWVARRAAADERLLWNKTCAECHETSGQDRGLPSYAPTNIPARWMPRAAFDHSPHLMVTCTSCHAAESSTRTSDVLLPSSAICASCHGGARRALLRETMQAESRCFECHRYHDWTKARPVTPSYSLSDLK
jgi:predicted CXXCH cytochrome family protein